MIEDEMHLVGADRAELEAQVATHPFSCWYKCVPYPIARRLRDAFTVHGRAGYFSQR